MLKLTRWGSDTTTKLIDYYGEHENLWNPNSPLYKNNIYRIETYKKIIKMLGVDMTVHDIRIKIKNLRSVYHVELRKIKNSKMTAQTEKDYYRPRLPWFEKMYSFLGDLTESGDNETNEMESSILNTNSNSSLNQDPLECVYTDTINALTKIESMSESDYENQDILVEGPTSPNSSYLKISEVHSEFSNSENTVYLNNTQPSVSARTSGTSIPKQSTLGNDNNAKPIKRKRKLENTIEVDNLCKAIKLLDNISSSLNLSMQQNFKRTENEFDLFGQYISVLLKQLPPRQACEMQLKIQTLLTEARLELINSEK
ncbi:uncharacterized protein LOC113373772 [Ctenocephalides felis]|uniref:uncharacterized protein LOC113373772 n=1 Tax=Ctenocephalides felis TaxID=7515 RepID=UPI000E6E2173|nr:uncharacterized protein LOC113373772 [Ctenocephalides felis]